MMRDAYAGNTAGYMHLSLPGITTQPLLHEAMQQDMDTQTDWLTTQSSLRYHCVGAAPQTVAITIYSSMEVKMRHADVHSALTAAPDMDRLQQTQVVTGVLPCRLNHLD